MYGEHGFDAEGSAWSLPSRITPALIGDAQRTLVAAQAAVVPTRREVMVRWVSHLGLRCRSTPDSDQAKAQVASYVRGFELAEIPGLAFTELTLERAAARFTFFPAYAELRDFLTEQAGESTRLVKRLRAIASSRPTEQDNGKGRGWADMTQQEREDFDLRMARVKDGWPAHLKPIASVLKAIHVPKPQDEEDAQA